MPSVLGTWAALSEEGSPPPSPRARHMSSPGSASSNDSPPRRSARATARAQRTPLTPGTPGRSGGGLLGTTSRGGALGDRVEIARLVARSRIGPGTPLGGAHANAGDDEGAEDDAHRCDRTRNRKSA